jgi:hypothetical protein
MGGGHCRAANGGSLATRKMDGADFPRSGGPGGT